MSQQAVFHVRPFHVGWRVDGDVDGRCTETIAGDRDRAVAIARYRAMLHEAATVFVHDPNGKVEERFNLP
jgi:hypothetical protein